MYYVNHLDVISYGMANICLDGNSNAHYCCAMIHIITLYQSHDCDHISSNTAMTVGLELGPTFEVILLKIQQTTLIQLHLTSFTSSILTIFAVAMVGPMCQLYFWSYDC